jgi:general secretion pathway protein M
MTAWQRAAKWWQARDGRERRMLAVMCAALAAFAWWYGLVAPMQRMREAARSDYLQTVREVQAMAADLERIAALRGSGRRPPTAETLPRIVLSSATGAGLAISRQRGQDDGFEIGIDSAETAQVFGWLDALRQQHGIAPEMLEIERRNGAVRVEARFRAPRPSGTRSGP